MKTRIYIRRPYLRAARTANHRLKPGIALLDGQEIEIPGAVYYVRANRNGKRTWEQVGSDPAEAMRTSSNKSESRKSRH